MPPQLPTKGLTARDAAARLVQYGPNEVAEEKRHMLLLLLRKFWAPVPWMLEATILLQLALGKRQEAVVIAILLVFNAALSFVEENRANRALALLRQRLNVLARVLRDGAWQQLPARELVPGDLIHLRLGDLVPADVRLLDTSLELDQSTLTGESLPVEAGSGALAYSGSIVRRGEASGEVTATGPRTRFGRTAELVRTATTASHLQTIIFSIVRYLVMLDVGLVLALVAYAFATGMPLGEVVPFALVLLVASVPVALPATFTLATAFGALELSRSGVLVTQPSAIEEAAAMDVLVTDKTGTLTENRIAVAATKAIAPVSEGEVLRLAALACNEATQDPIDLAILTAARQRGALNPSSKRTGFVPFDPVTRRSEATYVADGQTRRVVKGAPEVIQALVPSAPGIGDQVERLATQGLRVLAVAEGIGDGLHWIGLVALEDPPRADSAGLVDSLRRLGVRVVMATGDNQSTAVAIAARVGIGDRTCEPEALRQRTAALESCDVFARVYPEDKLQLVRALQDAGHVVGMTGDGVNDAPALKRAEVGVAVSNATDVAKAAASLVLTDAGLTNVVAAVQTSRRIYQRMLTYILNKIAKTLEIAIFMSIGVMLTGVFVITPKLVVLLLFTNDFVTMSIATDNVHFSLRPERWKVRNLMLTAAPLSALVLCLSFGVFFVGRDVLHLPLDQLQTLILVTLVFTGLGNVYLLRERRYLWSSRPSRWLLVSTLVDIVVVSGLAWSGTWMAPVGWTILCGLFVVTLGYLLVLDVLKVHLLRRLATA